MAIARADPNGRDARVREAVEKVRESAERIAGYGNEVVDGTKNDGSRRAQVGSAGPATTPALTELYWGKAFGRKKKRRRGYLSAVRN